MFGLVNRILIDNRLIIIPILQHTVDGQNPAPPKMSSLFHYL